MITSHAECARCGHYWKPRSDRTPKRCPKCGTEDWAKKRPSTEPQKAVENPGVNSEIKASVEPQKPMEPATEPEKPKKRIFARKKEAKQPKMPKPPKERKERKPRKRREEFFSEKHPGAHGALTSVGPRLHTIVLGVLFIYFSLREIAVGNYLFLLDWIAGLPIFNVFAEGIELYGIQEFIQQFWFLIVAVVLMFTLLGYVIHKVVWRLFFKDYFVVIVDKWGGTELTLSRDGRIYWYSNNFWHRLWDAAYGSPERKERKLWIHQRGKFFNILNPPASLITVTISEDEWLEARGVYGIIGHEKPVRHRIGRQDYITLVTEFSTEAVPLKQANVVFEKANDRLVNETRKLTQGNAALRLEQMRDGGFVLSQKVREIVHAEKQRETKDTAAD